MTDRFIARTGRVQSWLDNPESKLPVSCTVFVCDDSMEGPEGIEASWRFVSTPSAMLQVSPYTSASSAPGAQ